MQCLYDAFRFFVKEDTQSRNLVTFSVFHVIGDRGRKREREVHFTYKGNFELTKKPD